MAGVTVGERILVHLSSFVRFADAYECPAEMTQDGIAAALGISRAHAALELKRLRDGGKLEERMAHVANARTRRKVYVLLPAGQEIARRMREHARGRRVILLSDEGTVELSGAEAMEALRKHGLRESEAVQRVLAQDLIEIVRPQPKRAPAAPIRSFFGREDELRRLGEWLAVDPRPMAIVVGVAGIGKTALLERVLASHPRPTFLRRLYAHDDAHGLLASLADFLARQGRRRLRAVITRPAYDPVEALAVLREDLDGCVLALDDLQACDAAQGVLASLLEGPLPCRILVASRIQPTFYDRAAVTGGKVLEVPLGGLSPDAAEALLASHRANLEPFEFKRVLQATQGHPLVLELFAASGLEAGEVATERYVVDTVLEGLDDASERVLRTFAILRRPALSPEALGATVSQLRRLVRIAVLQHREEGYLVHDLVREFLLSRMDATERAWAHERAGSYWEARGDLLEGAYHRLEAGDPERAAILLAEGGEAYAESARAGDLEACLLRLPEALRPRRLLAETRAFLGKFEEARRVLEGVVRDGPPPEALRARIHLGRIANRLGDYAAARAMLIAAAGDAARTDPPLEAEALRALGAVERKLGELPAALEHLTRAVDLLGADSREKVRALIDLGAALIARGDLAGAKARLLQATPLVRKGSREEAAIQNNLAIVLSREGKAGEAAKAFERSADVAIRTGEIRFASYALANAAENLLRLDATDAASACAERAAALAARIGDPLALSTARANLGLVCARRGEWSKAETHLMDSLDLIARLENPYSLASRYEEIAKVYEAQGRAAEAAPWRARAEDLFARLRNGRPAGLGPPDAVGQSSDQNIK